VVLAVTDKRPLLLLCNQAYVLPDVALGLAFGKQLALLALQESWEGIGLKLLGETREGAILDGFETDGALELLLLHSLSIS
jgi:hypothetical protein